MSETIDLTELDEDEHPKDLLTPDQAAKRCRTSRRAFERRWASGDLPRYKIGSRQFRYSASDIEGMVNDDRIEDGSDLVEVRAAALLGQAYSHLEMVMKQVHAQGIELHTAMQTLNASLLERCAVLEASHTELIKAREEALNESADREALRQTMTAEQERKNELVKGLTDHFPLIISKLGGSSPYQKFFDSFTTKQITDLVALAQMSAEGAEEGEETLFTAEQLEHLETLLKMRTKAEAEKKAKTKAAKAEAEKKGES